jgi:hypothetical protein
MLKISIGKRLRIKKEIIYRRFGNNEKIKRRFMHL